MLASKLGDSEPLELVLVVPGNYTFGVPEDKRRDAAREVLCQVLLVAGEDRRGPFVRAPQELVQRCLDCGCPKGGVVLDPFVGSGTTMIAALARGSNAIGVDLKPEYSGYTMERIHRDLGAGSNWT